MKTLVTVSAICYYLNKTAILPMSVYQFLYLSFQDKLCQSETDGEWWNYLIIKLWRVWNIKFSMRFLEHSVCFNSSSNVFTYFKFVHSSFQCLVVSVQFAKPFQNVQQMFWRAWRAHSRHRPWRTWSGRLQQHKNNRNQNQIFFSCSRLQ